ncbi:unnamed protein product [Adineta ricciae]|uniref:Uncharacterized protein n=1 Tax=Adineta ricciae TaxID=249248 RepID=A0A815TFB0_ADIRI|nr:unnamed protein product [Adineta ricciae]
MIENLGLAQRVYRNGMKTLNILNDFELKQIFGPLEDILPLHEDLLFRLKPKGNSSIDAVGQIYLEWFQRIRSSYVSYCSNLINAKELLDAKRCEENGRVDDYLKRCTDSGFSRKLDLWDFLDQPRSRLMKYPILFKRIHKRTKDSHEDKRILLETINIVEELINDVSQATSAQICSNIIAKLVYTNDEQKHSLIETQTRLICQGELKNNRGQKLHVFLFDEIILFTRIATRNGVKSYQLTNYPISVEFLRIEDIEDGVKIPELSSGSFSRTLAGSKSARNVFRCSSVFSSDNNNNRNNSMLLQARDIYDKQQWLSAFRSLKITNARPNSSQNAFFTPQTAFYGQPNEPALEMERLTTNPFLRVGMKAVEDGMKDITGKAFSALPDEMKKSVSSIRYYFAVDQAYVRKKLILILFPFRSRKWSLDYSADEPVPPRVDANAPDYYIPLMSAMTYVLIASVVLGTQKKFTPEQLGTHASSVLIWNMIEIGLLSLIFYICNIHSKLGLLDLIAYCGYKYVGMIVVLSSYLITQSFLAYYCSLLYISISISFFLINCLRLQILPDTSGSQAYNVNRNRRRVYLLLLVTFSQPVFIWYLTRHLIVT